MRYHLCVSQVVLASGMNSSVIFQHHSWDLWERDWTIGVSSLALFLVFAQEKELLALGSSVESPPTDSIAGGARLSLV